MFWSHFKRPESWSLTINVPGFYLRNTPSTIAAIFELGVLQNGIIARFIVNELALDYKLFPGVKLF